MADRSETMRLRLAAVGILLDDPAPRASRAAAAQPVEVDRAEVRRILVERGARERDLDWLTASCPGEEYARRYTSPELRPVRRAYPRKEPVQAAERHNVTVHSEEKGRTET